jgi:predicted transcriptional regulator
MAPVSDLSDPIALRIPRDVLENIEKIAATCERTRSWVMVRALKAYLAGEGRDILAAAEAQRDIARGDVHDLDAVLVEIDLIIKGNAA